MATDITVSNPPGYYANQVTVKIDWPADARKGIITFGDIPPVLSEVLASDKGPILPAGKPNSTTARVNRPFMAVTQDGAGNIVYDGGFPKYMNMHLPTKPIVALKDVFRFQAWCNPANNDGSWGVGNDAYYETFSNQRIRIAAGDKLVYSELLYGLVPESGIDARVSQPAKYKYMRYWGEFEGLVDQNGFNVHPGITRPEAFGQWYDREIMLTPFVGKYMDQWAVAFEANNPGWYTSYFREIYIKDSTGAIKATLYKDKIDVPQVSPADEGDSGSYEAITKKVVDLTVFDQMSGACKYLYNVFRFIANPIKLAQGNNRLLVIGNTTGDRNYCIKNSMSTPGISDGAKLLGFKDVFEFVAKQSGMRLDYYDYGDAGEKPIDLRLAYLNTYAGVVFVSSYEAPTTRDRRITPRFAQEMALYRAQGNGVFVMTDHVRDGFTSAQDAVDRSFDYPGDANMLAQHWGSYFTNVCNRHPVSVEVIRRQMIEAGGDGTHPLLNNLVEGDAIFAGDDESMVIVDTYPQNQVPVNKSATYTLNTPGEHRINVLCQRQDGTVFVRPLKYTIIDPEVYRYTKVSGEDILANYTTHKLAWDTKMRMTNGDPVTLIGTVNKNNVVQGYWDLVDGVFTPYLFAGNTKSFDINGNDKIHLRIEQPYIYNVQPMNVVDAGRSELGESIGTVASGFGGIHNTEDWKTIAKRSDALDTATAYINKFGKDDDVAAVTHQADYPAWFNQLRKTIAGPLGNCVLWIAPTAADWTETKAPTVMGQAAIVAATNAVYYWDVIARLWVLHPQKADVLFGESRRVRNQRDNSMWLIGTATTVKQ